MNVSLFLINCSVVLLQLLSPSAFAARRFFFVGETNFGMFLFPIWLCRKSGFTHVPVLAGNN